MKQKLPNPANSSATIVYELQARSHVKLTVFDALGRLIATLGDGIEERGEKSVNFNPNGLASGEYSYRLSVKSTGHNGQTKSYTRTMNLFLLK